ncbi:hypothetical protein COCON_G00096890 [Conger conger]|uniref:Uncharacterized protein n=1 Tax=Conger conger TaxID=82655 RepID=A0A9Q1DMC0_CONCO|nr:hypothetical protein COCON_G00096890 [Conger conger]
MGSRHASGAFNSPRKTRTRGAVGSRLQNAPEASAAVPRAALPFHMQWTLRGQAPVSPERPARWGCEQNFGRVPTHWQGPPRRSEELGLSALGVTLQFAGAEGRTETERYRHIQDVEHHGCQGFAAIAGSPSLPFVAKAEGSKRKQQCKVPFSLHKA